MLEEPLRETLTFDDVLLVPAYSEVLPRDVDVRTRIARTIELRIPLVSAAMDSVTEARTAITMAREGGLGILHKNLTPEDQALEVEKVKRAESGIVVDPLTVAPGESLRDAVSLMQSRSISGLPQNFKFNIVAFSCSTRTWQRQMQEATDANKQSAMGWVRGLQPTDATGTGPGTCLALADRNNMTVVLLTDGAPNCGTYEQTEASHRNMIRNGNSQHATINVFGIAAYGSYRAFCQNVASDSGGSYYDVP